MHRFRFAEDSARAIDSLGCFKTATTTAISAFCKAVKEADRGILTGAFYGYYFGAGYIYGAMYLHCGDVEVENGKYNTVVYNTFTGEKVL